jgi:single-stranded-DNA-specific exonuclease
LKYKWVPRSRSVADAAFDGIDGIPASVASVLARRGFSVSEARAFIDTTWNGLSPWRNLPGAEEAAVAVADAIRAGEGILVHGDFDADGITAVSTSVRVLRALGARVDWHFPCRFNEGYVIGETGVQKAIDEGFGLFLTVDCGISAVDPVRLLSEAGVRTVITDHHLPGPEVPSACATVDPELSDDQGAPWRRLSGAGVALAVLRGVADLLGKPGRPSPENSPSCEQPARRNSQAKRGFPPENLNALALISRSGFDEPSLARTSSPTCSRSKGLR